MGPFWVVHATERAMPKCKNWTLCFMDAINSRTYSTFRLGIHAGVGGAAIILHDLHPRPDRPTCRV